MKKIQKHTADEMAGWYQLNEHEFEQTSGNSESQGSLVCCSPWGCRESDMTERLNSSDNKNAVYADFPDGSAGKEFACTAGDTGGLGSISGSG